MNGKAPLLIAGGGIAGLACALALARRGIATTLLEQGARFSELGAGIQISPNASRILISLGAAEAITARAVTPEAARIFNASTGAQLTSLPLGETVMARHGAPYWSVHRADLQRALLTLLKETGLCDIRTGTRLEGITWTGQDLRIRLHGLPDMPAAALIGADGLHSSVRAHVIGDGPPHFAGYVAWRALVDKSALPHEDLRNSVCLWLGRSAHLVHYPLRNGTTINIVAIVGTNDEQSGWSNKGDPRHLFPHYENWPEIPLALMGAAGEWRTWSLYDRPPARRWSRDCVTLIGDAAHPMLPFQAQGGAMAIEDAAALAFAISRHDSFNAAFQNYEKTRISRTARVQRQARFNGRVYHLDGIAAMARDALLGAMPPALFSRRQDWLYGYRL